MGGFFGCCGAISASSGSNASLGVRLTYASPAGSVAAAPAGFTSKTGRLIVTLAAGNAIWTSLTAGADGQLLEITNNDAANTLTLPQTYWGGIADLVLPPGNKVLAYYDTTLAAWQTTSP